MRKHPENRYPAMQVLLEDLELIADADSKGRDISELELRRQPDVYRPHHQKALSVAENLASYFGAETPSPPTSRLGSELTNPTEEPIITPCIQCRGTKSPF